MPQSQPGLTSRSTLQAIVLGHPIVRQFLINYARPLIYSTAMPRMNVVAVREVFRHLEKGRADRVSGACRPHKLAAMRRSLTTTVLPPPSPSLAQARTHVHALADLLLACLSSFASLTTPHVRLFAPPSAATSPIVPLLTPASALASASENARALAAHLQARGLLVRPITHPTVPRGKERVRVCLHAGNTGEDVGRLVDGIRGWVEEEERKGREAAKAKL